MASLYMICSLHTSVFCTHSVFSKPTLPLWLWIGLCYFTEDINLCFILKRVFYSIKLCTAATKDSLNFKHFYVMPIPLKQRASQWCYLSVFTGKMPFESIAKISILFLDDLPSSLTPCHHLPGRNVLREEVEDSGGWYVLGHTRNTL